MRKSAVDAMSGLLLAGTLACTGGCREVQHDAGTPRPAPSALGSSGGVATAVSSVARSTTPPAPWPPANPALVQTDWCIDAVTVLDEETCFVLPNERTTTLLVYFHGIVPPTRESHQKTNYQTVVANAARRARIVALLPRGRQGFAPAGHPGWWGWPTTESAYQEHARELVDSISRKREALERLLGVTFARTYLAGSSSGAYFVAAIALHGGMQADGFAALSGGAGRETAGLAKLEPVPFYIGYGSYDSVRGSANALGDLLRQAGWPVRVAEHPLGHGAREIYLDEAFEFFEAGH